MSVLPVLLGDGESAEEPRAKMEFNEFVLDKEPVAFGSLLNEINLIFIFIDVMKKMLTKAK